MSVHLVRIRPVTYSLEVKCEKVEITRIACNIVKYSRKEGDVACEYERWTQSRPLFVAMRC